MFRKDPTRPPPLNILSHPLEDVTRFPPLTIPLHPIEDVILIKELNLSGHRCDNKEVDKRSIWIRHAVIRNPCWQMDDPFTQNQNYYPTYIQTRDGSHIYVRKNYTKPDHMKDHTSRIALDNGNVSRRMTEFGMKSYMDISDDSDDNDSDNNEITNTIDEFRELTTDKLNDKDFMRYLELKYGKSSKHITSYEMRLFLDEIRDRKTEQTHEVPKDNVKVKVVFGDDICILRSDRLDENELKTFISQSFDLKGFHLKYEDEDHDMISINTKNDLENAFDCASVKRKCLKVFVFKNAVPKTVFTSSKHNTNGDTDSYESNSDMITAYKHNSGLIFILCVLCVILCLLCVEDRTSWRGKTWQEETKMSDKMEQYDVLEGRAYHLKTKETLHPLKVSRDDKEQQNGNKRTLMEDEQITLPTESVEDDSSASDSGDDNDTSFDTTEDYIDNIDSQDDVDCADNDSFEATDQESPDSINATDSQDEDNDNDNESQDEDDNINDNESENNDESQDTNSQESGDGDTSDMNESEEKEMKPAIQFKLKDKMGRYEVRWDGWSYNTWTGSLLYHPFNPMPYCMMSCQALNRSLECGTQTTHKNCRLNRVENQERSGIGWITNRTDWEMKNKAIRERLLGFKDGMDQRDIQCYGTQNNQKCIMQSRQTLNRPLVHQSLKPIVPLQPFCDQSKDGSCDHKDGIIDMSVMAYDISDIVLCEDGGTHKICENYLYHSSERMSGVSVNLLGFKDGMDQRDIQCYGTQNNQKCIMQSRQTLNRPLVHQSLKPIVPLQPFCDQSKDGSCDHKDGIIDMSVMAYDISDIVLCEDGGTHKICENYLYHSSERMSGVSVNLLGFKDGMDQRDIQCYGTQNNQKCNMQSCQTLNRPLINQSLNPLQSISDDIIIRGYDRKQEENDLNVMGSDTNRIRMSEEGRTHQVMNGGLNEEREGILAAIRGGRRPAKGGERRAAKGGGL
eukprot:948793_1